MLPVRIFCATVCGDALGMAQAPCLCYGNQKFAIYKLLSQSQPNSLSLIPACRFMAFMSLLFCTAAFVPSFLAKGFHVNGNFLWFASCDFPTVTVQADKIKKGQFLRNIMKGADLYMLLGCSCKSLWFFLVSAAFFMRLNSWQNIYGRIRPWHLNLPQPIRSIGDSLVKNTKNPSFCFSDERNSDVKKKIYMYGRRMVPNVLKWKRIVLFNFIIR